MSYSMLLEAVSGPSEGAGRLLSIQHGAPAGLLFALLGIAIAAIAIVVFRPLIAATREGRLMAFLALFILPVLCIVWGVSAHLEHSKQTGFCLSCHIMEPYGRSLYVDEGRYLAASHFQYQRVPAGEACYSCHTQYTMYGGFIAKLRGFEHVYKNYVGTPMNPLRLYEPYNNRECLICHSGARSFEEGPTHSVMMGELKSNQTSCLTGGCHDVAHNVAQLPNLKLWRPSE